MDEDLNPVVAIEAACRRLVLWAVACVDDGEPERLAEVYTSDAVLARPGGDLLVGRDTIVAAYRSRPAGRLTRHLVTNTLVDVESPVSARARSYVLVWSGLESEPVTVQGRVAPGRQMVGEFDDRFRLTPQGWRIVRRDARFVLYKE